MTAIAHFIAITCYIGAAALAATPFARPVGAPVRGVAAILAVGVLAHAAALIAFIERVASCHSPDLVRRCRSPASCSRRRCSSSS